MCVPLSSPSTCPRWQPVVPAHPAAGWNSGILEVILVPTATPRLSGNHSGSTLRMPSESTPCHRPHNLWADQSGAGAFAFSLLGSSLNSAPYASRP